MKRPKNTVRSISSDGHPGTYDVYLVGFPRAQSDHGLNISLQNVNLDSWVYLVPHLIPEARVFDYALFGDDLAVADGKLPSSAKYNCGEKENAAGEKYLTSAQDLENNAYVLLDKVKEIDPASENAEWRRAIFVGYGLGGHVVKQAMVIANTNPKYCDIALRTHQLVFVATPHADADIAKWEELLDETMTSAGIHIRGRKSQVLGELASSVRDTCNYFHCALNYRVVELPGSSVPSEGSSDSEIEGAMTETRLRDLLFPDTLLTDYLWIIEHVDARLFYSDLLDLLQYLSPSDRLLYRSSALHVTNGHFETDTNDHHLSELLPALQHSVQIVGPTGYGKRTLMRKIVRHIVCSAPNVLLLELLHEHHDLSTPALITILRSLVHQILSQRPALFAHIRPLYRICVQVSRIPTEDVLWNFLHILLRVSSDWKMLTVASNVDSWPETLKPYLKVIEDFLCSLSLNHTFVSSSCTETELLCPAPLERFYLGLDETYRNTLVGRRISHELQNLMPTIEVPHSRLPILSSLTHAERYAKCLARCITLSTPQAVESALQDCPIPQDAITRYFVDHLDGSARDWSRTIVSWLHVASRPLRTQELAVAVALTNGHVDLEHVKLNISASIESDINRHLDGLLRCEEDVVHFYDASVGRYLAEDWGLDQAGRNCGRLTDDKIVILCLQYIALVVSAELEEVCLAHITWRHQVQSIARQVELEFLEYAVRQWPRHYIFHRSRPTSSCSDKTANDELDDKVFAFLDQKNHRIRDIWYRLYCSGGLEPEVSETELRSLEIAVYLNLPPIVHRILSLNKGTLSAKDLGSLLLIAVRNDSLHLVDLFVGEGADKHNATREAATHGRIQCLERLLADRELTEDQTLMSSCVHLAVMAGSFSAVDYLCGTSPDMTYLDVEGKGVVHSAATSGKLDIIERLLQASGDLNLNATDSCGRTPLIVASQMSHALFVKSLLSRGVDPSLQDEDGKTALHHAVLKDQDIVKHLIKNGASVSQPDGQMQTPLHLSCRLGNMNIVKELIGALGEGESLNNQNREGHTALHLAAEAGHLTVIQLLLERGAEQSIKDNENREPFELAAAAGHLDSFRALKPNSALTPSVAEPLIEKAASMGQALTVRYLVKHYGTVNFLYYGRSPLGMAASSGYPEVVRLLLQSSADPNATDSNGLTPMHYAVVRGNVQVANILLDNKANPNSLDKDRWTPLHHAASEGKTEVTEALLEHGAQVNAQTLIKATALHLAVAYPDIVERLLDRGASLTTIDYFGRTPLHMAVIEGQKQSVQLLVSADKKVIHTTDENGLTPLHHILKPQHWEHEIFRHLWSHSESTDHPCYGEKPLLIRAIEETNVEAVKLLLQEDETLITAKNSAGNSCIESAISSENEDIVDEIIQAMPREDLEKAFDDGQTPLHRSASRGLLRTVERLLDLGSDIHKADEDGQTPLHLACWNRHGEVVTRLLSAGARPDIRSNRDECPLHLGADSESVVRTLISYNADKNAHDCNGWTPIMRAIYWEQEASVQALVELGADINLANTSKQTALHVAENERNPRFAKILLDTEADITVVDDEGKTPLHYAANCGHEGSKIEDLLDHGAAIDCKDDAGKMPLHYAVASHSVSAITLKALIEKHIVQGIDIDEKDIDQKNPLHLALLEGPVHAAQVLLDNKARLDEKDGDGQSCLMLAAASQYYSQEKIGMLLEHNASMWSLEDKVAAFQMAIKNPPTALVLARNDSKIFQELPETSLIVNECVEESDEAALDFVKLGANPFYRKKGCVSAFERIAQKFRDPDDPFIKGSLDALHHHDFGTDSLFQRLRVALEHDWTKIYESALDLNPAIVDDDGWSVYRLCLQHKQHLQIPLPTPPVSTPRLPTCFTIPDFWRSKSFYDDLITFTPDFKQVKYYQAQQAASVRANYPLPPRAVGNQYFEIKILEADSDTDNPFTAGIGLASEYNDMTEGFPGWYTYQYSMGYHSDDGHMYESSQGDDFRKGTGLFYQEGDVVGCGVSWDKESVYYTVNGTRVGEFPTKLIYRKLYPVVTVRDRACTFRVNFGEGWDGSDQPFMYAPDP